MLSDKLKKFRKENGLTVQAVADKIGVPKRTYEDWEAGRRKPDSFKERAVLERLNEKSPI